MRIPPKDGVEQIWTAIRKLQDSEQKRRGGAGMLENAEIVGGFAAVDRETGSRAEMARGGVSFWSDYEGNPARFGRIETDVRSNGNFLTLYAPYTEGDGRQNTITLQGTQTGVPGNVFVYTDGEAAIQADGRVYIGGDTVIDLVTPKLRLYGLADTGLAANLALEIVAGEPILRRSTSSDRYKDDVHEVAIDIDDLLSYSGITWVHRTTSEATPTPWAVNRNVGNHAEAMDALPSLRQFVNYDEQGRPDSVEDARFAVAVLELAKHTHARLVEHERTSAEQIAALTARLEALEAAQ